ncbi:hypothetical protein [Streptacidiphilus jiangxiensis]|uniref:Uncharacterized protein n=1 Tax=Streptacidiphilus jiangxiensis TaxID=235985 RepID=A0A1H8BE32_STRJI|nr:hypothetical protein [Streptacidiphilus jiangxiensis]SEM81006.1 hypothetical protein SAMN05414137_1633 [Streptacidiphilus jiangxiensis]
MTAPARILAGGDAELRVRHQQLVQALDEEFLGLVDWAWDLRVVTFPKEHPVLGIADCPVPGCVRGRTGGAVCDACTHRWKASGIALEEFVRLPSPGNRVVGQLICEVPGCPRPRLSPGWRLCSGHHYQRTAKLELTVEAFLAHPKVVPLTAPDVCQVASCFWLCDGPGSRYCRAHQARLAAAKRDGHFDGDEPKWQATETSPAIDRRVSLRGLPERLVAELLYGLQVRTESEIRTWDYTLRQVANRLRAMQATDIETLSDERVRTCGMSDLSRGFLLGVRSAARRLGSDPETECRKDVWDMAVFGHGGRLHFTKIDQPELREAAKIWAYDELPRRRGKKVTSAVQVPVNALGLLSESLSLQRPDQGRHIEQWSRQDIVAFLNRLAYLQHSGAMSHRTRQTTVEYVRHVLNRMRAMSGCVGENGERLLVSPGIGCWFRCPEMLMRTDSA